MRYLLPVLVAIALSACATTLPAPLTLNGRVTRFHVIDAAPRSFVLVPDDGGIGSLEWRTYAALAKQQLTLRGWSEVSFESADVAIFLQYQIAQGRSVVFSQPVFGMVPSGTSQTTGTITTYGNRATVNSTTTQGQTFGVVGTTTGSRTVYDRAVKVTMFSVPAYRESQRMESVYEAEIRSTGSVGDLPTVMPSLIQGLMSGFPGRSGSVNDVHIPIQ